MQRSGCVAIVDDDPSIRNALARLLRVHGIRSRSYSSARALLEALSFAPLSSVPDCLIVDVNMPDMTGIELQRELLTRSLHIPTIVITASHDKSIAANAASLGAAAFFLKPVPRDALIAAILSAKKQHSVRTLDSFDRSSVVGDWLDACRAGHLNALLNLYDERATMICDCDGVNLIGRNSIAIYLKSKLENRASSAFTRADITATADEIQVDCEGCKGKPVHVRFRLSPSGKILHTRFGPLLQFDASGVR